MLNRAAVADSSARQHWSGVDNEHAAYRGTHRTMVAKDHARLLISVCLILLGIGTVAVTSCKSTGDASRPEERKLDFGWTKGNTPWQATCYAPLKTTHP